MANLTPTFATNDPSLLLYAELDEAAMQHIQQWTAAFNYNDLDQVIDQMTACNAFERSRNQFKLLMPSGATSHASSNTGA
jgi:cell wall assembly regulator SMI1